MNLARDKSCVDKSHAVQKHILIFFTNNLRTKYSSSENSLQCLFKHLMPHLLNSALILQLLFFTSHKAFQFMSQLLQSQELLYSSVRPDQVLNLDCIETDMIVNPQTSPPSGFLNANGMRFQFQLLPSNYCIVHSYVEFDISNTTSVAVQLTPLPFLVDRIRIRNGASNILQEATCNQIYQELCFNYSQNQLINLQSLINTSATTFGSYATIAEGATMTYSIPLSCMFLDQIKFFTGSLGSACLIVEVLSNGPACVIKLAATPASINLVATRLRITAETISQHDAEALIKEHRSCNHLYKVLDAAHQSFSLLTTSGNQYNYQLQALNGLVPFPTMTLRSSLTGARLYTYAAITDYDLRNKQNVLLLNGFRVPFYISNNLVVAREFDSQFWTLSNAIPMTFVNKPGELIKHPCNIGAEAWLNNFISFTTSNTGNYTINIYIYHWSSLLIKSDRSAMMVTS